MHIVVKPQAGKRSGQPLTSVNNVAGPNSDECFLLHVTDAKTNEKYLVDGGALLSIVPPTYQQRLKGPNATKLKAANGSDIACYGYCNRTIVIGTQAFTFNFIIANVQSRILGADFLAKNYLAPNHRDATPSFTIKEPSHGVRHHIPTSGAPVQSRARRLNPEKLAVAKAELEKLVELGVCYRGKSEWSSPLLVTTKPNGGWRVCGDYRRLNGLTTDDRYPVRSLQDFTAELQGKLSFRR